MALIVGELAAYLTLDDTQYQQGIDRAQGNFDKTRQAIQAGTQAVATTFAATTTAIAGLGVALLQTGLGYNRLQQSSRAALSTLLGGAEAANAQMDKLDEFARTSPFAKDVFITAQQQLIGFGMSAEKVIPTLDAVQQAVAATGGSSQQLSEIVFVLAQIQAAGKVTGQDLMQLGQRGIDAATMVGTGMGKTGQEIREMITKGELSMDDFLTHLTASMQDRFGGATANIKQQFDGAADRIKAAWRDIGALMAKPLIDPNGGGQFVRWGNDAADVLRAIQKQAEPAVDILWNRLAPAVSDVTVGFHKAKVAIGNFDMSRLNGDLDLLAKYAPLIAPVAGYLFAMGLATTPLHHLGLTLNPVVTAIAALVLASPELRKVGSDFLHALTPAIGPAKDLAAIISGLLLDSLSRLTPALASVLMAAAPVATSFLEGIIPAFSLAATAAVPVLDIVGSLADAAAQLPTPVLGAALAFLALRGYLGPLQGAISKVVVEFTAFRQAAAVQAHLGGVNQATGALAATMVGAQGAIRGVGAALKTAFLSNPIGIAIAALTTAWMFFADAQREAREATEGYRGTLDATTGAITDQTRAMIANRLEAEGVLQKYRDLGGDAADLVDSVLGIGTAHERVKSILSEHQTVVGEGETAYLTYKEGAQDVASAVGEEARALQSAKDAHESSTDATRRSTDATQSYTDALKAQIDAQDEASSTALSVADAQVRAAEQYDRNLEVIKAVNAAIAEGTAVTNANADAFNLNTKEGRDAQSALADTARRYVDLTDAMYDNKASANAQRDEMVRLRASFIEQAQQMGLTKEAAERLADSYGLIPENVYTRATLDTSQAMSAIDALNRTLNSINGKTVTAYTVVRQVGQAAVANGGILVGGMHTFAGGGIRPTGPLPSQATIMPPRGKGLVQWAEDETHGEGFIPLAPSKRENALRVWKEIGHRFGVLASYADGGTRTATHASSDGGTRTATHASSDGGTRTATHASSDGARIAPADMAALAREVAEATAEAIFRGMGGLGPSLALEGR